MDNQEKKYEVKLKVSTGTQIGVAIAILAVVAAGAGLAGFFLTRDTTTKSTSESAVTPSAPGAFKLQAPVNRATDRDYIEKLAWTASSGATSYDVYIGTKGSISTPVANVTTTSYEATELDMDTTYSWKIVAKNKSGQTESSTWSFATAGPSWFSNLEPFPAQPDPIPSSACGAQVQCNEPPPAPGESMNCSEFNRVWQACSGIGNRCPDHLFDKCYQMTICQCNNLAPGSPECESYFPGDGTPPDWVDPCE